MKLQFSRKVEILDEHGRRLFTAPQVRAATLLAQGVVVRIDNRREIRCLQVPTHQLDDYEQRLQNLKTGSDSSTRLHYREATTSGTPLIGLKRNRAGEWRRWPATLTFAELRAGG
jgi:hypothetical protein